MFLISAIKLTYIVCIIVVLLFAFAFIGIASLFFNARKAVYVNRLEDDKIQNDVDKSFIKLNKKKKNGEDVLQAYDRSIRTSKKVSNFWTVILSILYVGVIGLAIYGGISRTNGNQLFIGNQAGVIIETSSMQEAYSGNTYLKDQGLLDESNRIDQYSFITLNKVESEEDLKLWHVYAFKMPSTDKGQVITIVHRLIDIKTNSEGHKVFSFRGDSNVSSMVGELNLTFDKIVGEWSGYQNKYLGYFVVYLQSPIGIITLVIAFLLLILYSILYSKMTEKYNIRFCQLLAQKYCFAKALDGEKSVYVYPSEADHDVIALPKEKEGKKKKGIRKCPYIDVRLPSCYGNLVSSSLSDMRLVDKGKQYLYQFDYQNGFFGNGQHLYDGAMRKGCYRFSYREKPSTTRRLAVRHEAYPLKVHLISKAQDYFIIHEVPTASDFLEYVGNEKEEHFFFLRFFDAKGFDGSVVRHVFVTVDEKIRRL